MNLFCTSTWGINCTILRNRTNYSINNKDQDQTNSFILGNQSPYLNSPIFLFFREIATTTMKLQKRLWHLCNQLDWEVLWPKMHALLQNQFYSVFILVAHSFGFSNRRERRDTYIMPNRHLLYILFYFYIWQLLLILFWAKIECTK